MIDPVDLAILETHVDVMNPVERGLVEEMRRLTDEHEDASALRVQVEELEGERDEARAAQENAEEEARDLQRQLDRESELLQSAEHARDCAERALTELKAKLSEVLS